MHHLFVYQIHNLGFFGCRIILDEAALHLSDKNNATVNLQKGKYISHLKRTQRIKHNQLGY